MGGNSWGKPGLKGLDSASEKLHACFEMGCFGVYGLNWRNAIDTELDHKAHCIRDRGRNRPGCELVPKPLFRLGKHREPTIHFD